MSDKPEENPEQEDHELVESVSSDDEQAGETGDVTSEQTGPADPAEALEAALEQVASLKDQALRAAAEAENARRRASRDVENAHKFALEKFVGELLPVLDSLEKAVESASAADDEQATAIAEGVQLSLKMFLDVMTKMGVTQLDPRGEPFDPQQHEAMAMVPNPDLEPNSVMEVMQKGYTLNGRLVRAAMVVVSKASE
jgi:molecular chaperone GrpE